MRLDARPTRFNGCLSSNKLDAGGARVARLTVVALQTELAMAARLRNSHLDWLGHITWSA